MNQNQLEIAKQELIHEKSIYGLEPTISKCELRALKRQKPIQKILGFVQFRDVKIALKQKVFIPRYETEEVLFEALKFVKPGAHILDLCAGSGFLGLSIKFACPLSHVTLVDVSRRACKQIRSNAILNNNLKVSVLRSNLFAKISERFDLIVCNPPYIPTKTRLSKSVTKYEPSRALWGGNDGNDFYKKILTIAPHFLQKSGKIVFEISPANEAFLRAQGLEIKLDMNGKARIAIFEAK